MSLWNDLLDTETRWLDVGGVRTRTVAAGRRGPLLLLLHGRGGHLETWHRNIAHWARTRRVVAADLLGHGGTDQAGTSYDVPELLDHAAELVETLLDGAEARRADVVGQSLGGWVAAWLSRRPEHRIRRQVLIEPAGLQAETERLADPRVAAAFERGGRAFDQPTTETVRLRLRQLLHDPQGVDEEMVELRRRLYARDGATAVHRAVREADNSAWVLTDDRWASHPVPTLFLRGESAHTPADRLADAAAAAPRARVLTVSEAKQWPHYEAPATVNTAVARFLDDDGGSP